MRVFREGPGKVDEVGVVHRYYRGGEIDGVLDVEPPKPPPAWLLKLRNLVRRAGNSGAKTPQ